MSNIDSMKARHMIVKIKSINLKSFHTSYLMFHVSFPALLCSGSAEVQDEPLIRWLSVASSKVYAFKQNAEAIEPTVTDATYYFILTFTYKQSDLR